MIELEFKDDNVSDWFGKMEKLVNSWYWVKKQRFQFRVNGRKTWVNTYSLTKSGIEVWHDNWPTMGWFKSNTSPIVLEHNYICLRVIKEFLKIKTPYSYFLASGIEYLRNKKKMLGIGGYLELNSVTPDKCCDFIYTKVNNGLTFKVAAEIELTLKASYRYYGNKVKNTVFSKLNRDFDKGLFTQIEYYVPRMIYNSIVKLFQYAPAEFKLKAPYKIYILEEILPGFTLKDKWVSILPKKKCLTNSQESK